MRNTEIGAAFVLSRARLSAPAGVALDAGGLAVQGGVFLVEGFTAKGQIRLIGARLGADLALAGAVITNPGAMALDLRPRHDGRSRRCRYHLRRDRSAAWAPGSAAGST